MDFVTNSIKPTKPCYYDEKLKCVVHRFKMAASICECGRSEVKIQQPMRWNQKGRT